MIEGGAVEKTGWTDEAREAALRARASKLRTQGDVAGYHAHRIAADSLRMPNPIANVMGGPSQDQAREMADRILGSKKEFDGGRKIDGVGCAKPLAGIRTTAGPGRVSRTGPG